MSVSEWESLCDGCALCCLHKLEDDETFDIYYTGVTCRLLDPDTCLCSAYEKRFTLVEDCIKIKPKNFSKMHVLPRTCAYRLLYEGKPLEWWHYLISGDRETVHEAGISLRGGTIPEDNIHPEEIPDFILFKVDNEV